MTIEYKVIRIGSAAALQRELNASAIEGWRLMPAVFRSGDDLEPAFLAVLERVGRSDGAPPT